MGLGKALGIGLVTFLGLNFLMSILYIVSIEGDLNVWFQSIGDEPFIWISASLLTVLTLQTSPSGIMYGLANGIALFESQPFTGIVWILAPLVPGLITTILVSKFSNSKKQALISMLAIMAISAAGILICYELSEPSFAWIIVFIQIGEYLTTVGEDWAIYVFTPLVGIFNGLFWGGLASLFTDDEY